MACNCICKTRYTRNAIRTFDYIEKKSVQSFGASREKFQTILHGQKDEDVQAIHWIIAPKNETNLDHISMIARKAGDQLCKRKYPVRIAIHQDPETKTFHAHILVNRMSTRTDKVLLMTSAQCHDLWRGIKKKYGDETIERAKKPESRIDRRKSNSKAFDRMQKHDSTLTGWQDKSLRKIALGKSLGQFQQLKSARAQIPQRIAPSGIMYDSFAAKFIAKNGLWLYKFLFGTLDDLFKYIPKATKEILSDPSIAPRAAYVIDRAISQMRFHIEEDKIDFAIEQISIQRRFFGQMKVTAVLKDQNGKPKMVKQFFLNSTQDVERQAETILTYNKRGFECYVTPLDRKRFVTFDDIKKEDAQSLPPHQLIETSKVNFTAIVRFDSELSHDEFKQIQKRIPGADKSNNISSSRLVMAVNHKRKNFVSLVSTGLVNDSPHIEKKNDYHFEQEKKRESPFIQRSFVAPRKSWNDFSVTESDKSKTDWHFTRYLLSCGYSIEHAADELKRQSPERGKHESYFLLTARNAADSLTRREKKTQSLRKERSFDL